MFFERSVHRWVLSPSSFIRSERFFATLLISSGVAPTIVMKVCGWKDLKTMQRYIRLAGIEEMGATEGLNLLQVGSMGDLHGAIACQSKGQLSRETGSLSGC